ncbi:MAG: hypothetical protein WDW38_006810 [Sanguina aurantia]
MTETWPRLGGIRATSSQPQSPLPQPLLPHVVSAAVTLRSADLGVQRPARRCARRRRRAHTSPARLPHFANETKLLRSRERCISLLHCPPPPPRTSGRRVGTHCACSDVLGCDPTAPFRCVLTAQGTGTLGARRPSHQQQRVSFVGMRQRPHNHIIPQPRSRSRTHGSLSLAACSEDCPAMFAS